MSYNFDNTDEIKLTTLMKIFINHYQPGEKIKFIRDNMRQELEYKINGKIRKIELKDVFDGFPIDWN